MSDLLSRRGLRLVIPVLGLLTLGLFAGLYVYQRSWYYKSLTGWFGNPFPSPFLDTDYITAGVECWSKGIDVYISNPCDLLRRPHNYSPLWLRATFLPTGHSWTNCIGMALDSLFIVSLAALPVPRQPRDFCLIVLATFSSATAFALERGNMDVLMFLLCIVAGVCWGCSFAYRVVGYAAAVLAGLLKFYPFVMLLLMLRERVTRFVALGAVVVAIVVGFVWAYQNELPKMAHNLPTETPFDISFGMTQLPDGMGFALQQLLIAFGVHGATIDALGTNLVLSRGMYVLLTLGIVVVVAWLVRGTDIRSAFVTLSGSEVGFLVIGAVLTEGCFFAGQSVYYRGIHLLIALPGVLALSHLLPTAGSRIALRCAGFAIVFVMWDLAIENIIEVTGKNPVAVYIEWFLRELAWWWIAAIFTWVLFCFVMASPVLQTIWLSLAGVWRQRRVS